MQFEKRDNVLISVEIVPHSCQRYPTAGDWQFEPDGSLTINVSRMADMRYMLLVAIHEIIEALACKAHGITDQEVTNWDKAHLDDIDPGGIPSSPYALQHFQAECIEQMLANILDVNWDEYGKELEKL